jgi:hypothetical protein
VQNEVKTVRLLYVIDFSSTGLRRIRGVHGDVEIPCSAIWRHVDWNMVKSVSIFRVRSTLEVEALVTTWQ